MKTRAVHCTTWIPNVSRGSAPAAFLLISNVTDVIPQSQQGMLHCRCPLYSNSLLHFPVKYLHFCPARCANTFTQGMSGYTYNIGMGVGNIYRAAWPQTVWEDLFSSPKPELEEGMYSYIMLQYAALVATDSFSVLIKGKMVWGTCGSSLIFCDSPKLTLTKTLWNINMSSTPQSREQNHSSWLYAVPGIGLSWRKQDRDWPSVHGPTS